MIEHISKHGILKHLAEAGSELLRSEAPKEIKKSSYQSLLNLIQKLERLDESGECNCEPYETEETMPLEEAVDLLSSGHALWEPQNAFQICKALNVPFPKHLLQHWYSDWSDPKGMHMNEGHEGSLGMWSLALSAYVAEELGVKDLAGSYIGRGFQAQAYAREVKKLLVEQGKLKLEKEVQNDRTT